MADSDSRGVLPTTSVQRLRAHLGRLVIGLSGGMDSVVLLDAVQSLTLSQLQPQLHAVHVNHHLQPVAGEFEQVCRDVTQRLGVQLTVLNVSVPEGGSLEESARRARYEAFATFMEEDDLLLLAHHREDQVETLLLSILRGQHPTGGMPHDRPLQVGQLFRPLLPVAHSVLFDYAIERELRWVDDPSNDDTSLDRNYIRHNILPNLANRFENAIARMFAVTERLAQRERLLRSYASRDLETVRVAQGYLDIEALLGVPEIHRGEVIRSYLDALGLPQPGERVLSEVLRVLSARPDAEPEIRWQNVVCRRYRGNLMMTSPDPGPIEAVSWVSGEPMPREISVLNDDDSLTGKADFLVGRERAQDGHGLRDGLAGEFRSRRPGDRFADGRRLKDVFVEVGVPHWVRGFVPLFCADAGILAIPALPAYGTPMVVARGAEVDSGGQLRVSWPGQPYSD
ncbi:MAG: tRNA lysidine(34) synthetase TilS [Gammaproteobacteria bacterium]|uniref:tRNA(Ile)-lysidine synthase n=1 Tax=OM182 bacterium MED-G24 TaxID=1986255 RepID=A0A2A5WXY6_9GAMM|nr:tRNA lysidine(34) synthetase TilS [Gammaproteobacteria bacterium]PDH41291.1 MAG: tRNA lysidine(34) synthetase TilS [OM182 bacterium MED-G24]|tara:strand:- start:8023 stop:9384 length:1362 start_codon:yes stop_codon:yes gene_type:complete